MTTLERLEHYRELLDDAEACDAFVTENSDDKRFVGLVQLHESLRSSFKSHVAKHRAELQSPPDEQ